ncbi:MAG: hypothetical protein C5B59_10975 [Bacteroidetes bacterium]|nr:MAG: hypothetical protein C5B59_10975 [Bacteroidota bacterium]
MKNLLLLLVIFVYSHTAFGQLKAKATCAAFVVDILNGKVNELKPNYTPEEIKSALPCFTSADVGGNAKCGGGVFYKDKDVYFYTDRDYVEIGEKFKGQLSIPLLGASRNSLFKWLGNPKIKDDNWDAFQMNYGTLVLHYNAAGKVKLIQFSTNSTDILNLCE